tara:strand:- start:583 stop:1077 length:495 start_codon:yes stop_codon:yes gene_type:complete
MKIDKNGFQTKVWGAPAWLFLHCIAFNYLPDKKKKYIKFFKSLADVLPCKTCRDNYSHIIYNSKYKIDNDSIFKNRRSFSKWLFLIHNKVQRDIYKKNDNDEPMYTDDDFKKVCLIYEKYRAKCKKNQYGCTEPYKKGGKKRTLIRIKRFSKNICSQKHAIKIV